MARHFTTPITYFLQEGKENLEHSLLAAFQAARIQNINKIIIFTGQGLGVRLALDTFSSQSEYAHIKLIAVTFPSGEPFTDKEGNPIRVEIPDAELELFHQKRVSVIRAHLPFDPIAARHQRGELLGQDLSLIGQALNMFGGSMALCVQAVILACDAGLVELGEHVISLTSDTAILAQATTTRRMLRELVVREIICKPAVLTISRKETAEKLPKQLEAGEGSETKAITQSEAEQDKQGN